MISFKKFEELNSRLKGVVLQDTFLELETGIRQKHSLNTIALQDRSLAVGCRMIASGSMLVAGKNLTGKDIADIFVDAVRQDGYAYYPLTVDWSTPEVEQLVLFVKNSIKNKYEPYVRFKIVCEPIKTTVTPEDCNDQSVLNVFAALKSYKTLLKISEPELFYHTASKNGENIIGRTPSSFVAVYSGKDIYDSFKGASPSILML